MVASPNTHVTLNCEAFSMDGSVQYYWEAKGFIDTNWTVDVTAQSMSFNVRPLESQQYRCVAVSDAGEATSEVANITVLSKH